MHWKNVLSVGVIFWTVMAPCRGQGMERVENAGPRVLEGLVLCERFHVRAGEEVWVLGDTEIRAAGEVRIDGVLRVARRDVVGEGRGLPGDRDAPDLLIESGYGIFISGVVQGARGVPGLSGPATRENCTQRGGAGSDLTLRAPFLIVDGLVVAGNGGASGPNATGARGGHVVVQGNCLTNRFSRLRDGAGSMRFSGMYGGDAGQHVGERSMTHAVPAGAGGQGGRVMIRPSQEGRQVPSAAEAHAVGLSAFGLLIQGNGSRGGNAARGGAGLGMVQQGNGGSGGGGAMGKGGNGGDGSDGAHGDPASPAGQSGAHGSPGNHGGGGNGSDGGDGGSNCPRGPGGEGGRGGGGGFGFGGNGGNGGRGGDAYFDPNAGGYLDRGGNGGNGGAAGSGHGGNGGYGGRGGAPFGPGGGYGAKGIGVSGIPGIGSAGGRGLPSGLAGFGGAVGSSVNGLNGKKGAKGPKCAL